MCTFTDYIEQNEGAILIAHGIDGYIGTINPPIKGGMTGEVCIYSRDSHAFITDLTITQGEV